MTIEAEQVQDILDDPSKAATLADLIYVTDKELTIERKRLRKDFEYLKGNKPLLSKKQLDRIKNLVIPPAWEEVRIAEPPNGHIQVVGRDAKNRKVYRYHETWTQLRNQTKFFKMAAFGELLPTIRKRVDDDLDQEGMPKSKVLALIVRLMEETHIRVGNEYYAKKNKTYGLSTLRTRHVETSKNKMKFHFVGKKGKEHEVTLRNKKLRRLVTQCEEIPGWELFKYFDESGDKHTIDSSMVNEYIHELCGEHFSAKDFRTWSGTKVFFETLHDIGYVQDEDQNKKNILKAFDASAKALGNTRAVCRKYYVHPEVVTAYEDGGIQPYFDRLDKQKTSKSNLSPSEELLLEMIAQFEIRLD
ncbi:DNA topoisomerase IB [Croceiramulus getboli]|nr:DNA topoisomerase IB [Flavobacteriaceae bacterium YJPT1-3]